MKTKLLSGLIACLFAVSLSFAQTSTDTSKDQTPTQSDQSKRSSKILKNMAKVDMLFFFLPLAMTKDQLKKLLPAIEKARKVVHDTEVVEAKMLAELEAEVDKALKDGIESGKVPTIELHKKMAALYRNFDLNRRMHADLNVDNVLAACLGIWNAGQRKVAANALDLKGYDPSLKVDEMKEEDKIRIFVDEVVLHAAAYDVLVELSLKK